MPPAITRPWTISAAASSRRPAPMARATAEARAPPMLEFAICCMSIISGNTSAKPARAFEPSGRRKYASTPGVTAISTTLTTRFGAASRKSVETIGPSSSRRVRAAPGFWSDVAGAAPGGRASGRAPGLEGFAIVRVLEICMVMAGCRRKCRCCAGIRFPGESRQAHAVTRKPCFLVAVPENLMMRGCGVACRRSLRSVPARRRRGTRASSASKSAGRLDGGRGGRETPGEIQNIRRCPPGVGHERTEETMSRRRDDQPAIGRRNFLKGATLAGAAALTEPVTANAVPAPPQGKLSKAAVPGPRQMALETQPPSKDPVNQSSSGGDFMVDVFKTLDIDYLAMNCASSFRGLHEAVVNYGNNTK